MANKDIGYVYILTNPSFREDWVKIGMTSNMEERLKTLDNTSVPLPFEKYATLKTAKYQKAEKLVHHYIERFTNLRIRDNREFFNVRPEVALSIFREVAELLDDAEIEEFSSKPKKSSSKTKERKEKTNDIPSFKEDIASVGSSPRFCSHNILPQYFIHLNSKLIRETMDELRIKDNISEINNIDLLKKLREAVKEKEKERDIHGTYSCSISKYLSYLENGYTYQDFEYDVNLVNNQKGSDKSQKPLGLVGQQKNTEEGIIFRSIKTMPRYYSALKGTFIKEIMNGMNISSLISDITDLKVLKQIHTEILKKEQVLNIHHTYSCALSQYIQYLENGFSFSDLEQDARTIKARVR
ncbi:MAG: GIY-YIG nuclease family protein [Prevotella sp.]|nr:GIY-YIG nuclease family protein [Prevotella sp.]